MRKEQIYIGVLLALLSACGLIKDRWFLTHTKKGQRLTRWFGEVKAIWILRGLFGLGVLAGILLVMNVIRPLKW